MTSKVVPVVGHNEAELIIFGIHVALSNLPTLIAGVN
jgi:hypothetical protein